MKKTSKKPATKKSQAKAAVKSTKTVVKTSAISVKSKSAPKKTKAIYTMPAKLAEAPLPMWATLTSIVLIGLAYAIYRFWGIATVNGITISRLDYYQAMEQQVGTQVLDGLITETLILDAARQQGLSIDPSQAEIDAQIETIKQQFGSDDAVFEQELARFNMTMADLRADIEKNIRLQTIVETLATSEAEISDEAIDEFLEDNADFLPADLSAEEERDYAVSQLEMQQQSQLVQDWVTSLKDSATIIYR